MPSSMRARFMQAGDGLISRQVIVRRDELRRLRPRVAYRRERFAQTIELGLVGRRVRGDAALLRVFQRARRQLGVRLVRERQVVEYVVNRPRLVVELIRELRFAQTLYAIEQRLPVLGDRANQLLNLL